MFFSLAAAAAAKGAMYYVAKAMVIFPRVKISCFRAKLTWYFMCVYIIKNGTFFLSRLKQRDFFYLHTNKFIWFHNFQFLLNFFSQLAFQLY